MLRFLVARVGAMLVMAVLATLVVFLIANTVPGDPVLAQLGDQAASDPAFVAEWRHQYGLDRPLWERYVIFLDGLRHGDLGRSIRSRRPVLDDVEEYSPATIELATVAFGLTLLIGIPLGVARRGEARYLDRPSRTRRLAAWRVVADILACLHFTCDILRSFRTRPRTWAAGPDFVAAADGDRIVSDRRGARRRLGDIPRCRGASRLALDRAGGRDDWPDHAHHAGQRARKHPAGLRPDGTRQGTARKPRDPAPCAAERAGAGGHTWRARLCQSADRRGPDGDRVLLARARPIHLPECRRRWIFRRSWRSRCWSRSPIWSST